GGPGGRRAGAGVHRAGPGGAATGDPALGRHGPGTVDPATGPHRRRRDLVARQHRHRVPLGPGGGRGVPALLGERRTASGCLDARGGPYRVPPGRPPADHHLGPRYRRRRGIAALLLPPGAAPGRDAHPRAQLAAPLPTRRPLRHGPNAYRGWRRRAPRKRSRPGPGRTVQSSTGPRDRTNDDPGSIRSAVLRSVTAVGEAHWAATPIRCERSAIFWVRGRRRRSYASSPLGPPTVLASTTASSSAWPAPCPRLGVMACAASP